MVAELSDQSPQQRFNFIVYQQLLCSERARYPDGKMVTQRLLIYTLITLAIFHHLLSHYYHPLRCKEPGKEVMMIISKLNRTEALLIFKLV